MKLQDQKTLDFFRNLLLEEKAQIENSLNHVEKNVADNAADLEDESSIGEQGDLGTDVFEQQRELAQREELLDRMDKVDKALLRIEEGTFGISEVSGKPIPLERLKVLPWTTYLVEEERETGQTASNSSTTY
jgi:DnaK suppressor protein